MDLLAQLSFGTPLVLGALILLPMIWLLLRVTPPSPRRVVFPPLRLLLGLRATEEMPARTPWWLLLLRLLVAALIIVALAEPLLGESKAPPESGPLVLFIDNGWTAAHRWNDRIAALTDSLRQAQRDKRAVAIVPTAARSFANVATLLDAGAADRAARELEPQAWLPARIKAASALAKLRLASPPEIVWLSDGLDYGDARATAEALARLGRVKIVTDAPGRGPLALRPPQNNTRGFSVTVVRGDVRGKPAGQVNALGLHGEQLASGQFRFAEKQSTATAEVHLPIEVRNEMAMLSIGNEDSAGSVQLMDSNAKRRIVGLATAGTLESETLMLSDTYYLRRALEPYADLRTAPLGDLINSQVAVLILADVAKVSGDEHDRIERFVENGGVLIRFAGERMTGETDDLVPVKLRTGGRYLGGALAWSTPQHLAEFPENSPFRGLEIPAEVTVSRQILAEPSVELSDRTWARLTDGTPLVTAKAAGKGWIVLFHITASPAWSSLPLSGLYVDMLRRLTQLSSGARPSDMATDANAMYPASEVLDGFGRLRKAPADIPPIRASLIGKIKASVQHPPGLYGASGVQVALNAFGTKDLLTPMRDVGPAVSTYAASQVIALEPPLLALAAFLLLVDALISLWMRGYVTAPRRIVAVSSVAVLAMIAAPRAHADDAFDMTAANSTRLAYVKTGLDDVDAVSRAGLYGLGLVLKTRTTFEPQEPIGIDIAHDNLAFFPLLYWPMDPREKDLTPAEISKLSDYMRNGGTIVFDTRDATLGATPGPNSPGQQALRRLAKGLDLPPLQVVPGDHVLTKTFYLLQDFPGRWDGGKVWVEALPPPEPGLPVPARGGDGVSPVIIGANDWAAAWAVDHDGRPLNACVPGGDQQREMAFRVGVNLVMYALTGNYKTDQVHAPALLERLGK